GSGQESEEHLSIPNLSLLTIQDVHEHRSTQEQFAAIQKAISAVNTGEGFFESLVLALAEAIRTKYVFVGRCGDERCASIETIRVAMEGKIVGNIAYSLRDTPCQDVVSAGVCYHASGVQEAFPKDELLAAMGVDSYLGVSLMNSKGHPIGILVALDDKPMRDVEGVKAILSLLAARAGAEIERLETEEALRRREATISTLYDNLAGMAYLRLDDESWTMRNVSDAVESITGFAAEEFLAGNLSFKSLIHPDDVEPTLADLEVGKQLTGQFDVTYRVRDGDGEVRWVQERGKFIPMREDGTPPMVEGLVIDITEHIETQIKLVASQRELAGVLENLPGAVYRTNIQDDFRIEYVSDGIRDLLGYRPDELMHPGVLPFAELIHPEDAEGVRGELQAAASENRQTNSVFRLKHKDGRWVWAEGHSAVRYDEYGVPTHTEGFIADVSARVNAEQDARENREMLRGVLESVPGMVFRCRNDGYFTLEFVSEGSLDVFGFEPKEMLESMFGRGADVCHPDDLKGLKDEVERAILEERTAYAQFRALHRDGAYHWRELRAVYRLDDEGNPAFLEGIIMDISALKAREAEIRTLNAELEERVRQRTYALELARKEAEGANRAKSEFLSSMSHEIRTPLNGILGTVELLTFSSIDDKQAHALKTIQDSGKSLMRVLDDVLDLSKIEAGRLSIAEEEFSVLDSVESVIDMMASVAKGKGVSLFAYVDPQLPKQLIGDGSRVRQILFNLIGNAVKFTESGRVQVVVSLITPPYSSEVEVRFEISDTGIGMTRETMKRLFQPFTQSNAASNRKFGGTVLGLVICRRLSEMMGGGINVSSEVDIGTTFTVTLPFKSKTVDDELSTTDAHLKSSLNGLRVMIVSRPGGTGIFLADYLRHWGVEVGIVGSIALAVDRFNRESSVDLMPDVIVLHAGILDSEVRSLRTAVDEHSQNKNVRFVVYSELPVSQELETLRIINADSVL
ncbi:MAG: PAS domain-containing protein, partial [Planctomycetes bacterium]|nr:PAS domain-containing protein [Planctomycetota bacterium]